MRSASSRRLWTTLSSLIPTERDSQLGLTKAGKATSGSASPGDTRAKAGTGTPFSCMIRCVSYFWIRSFMVCALGPMYGMPLSSSMSATHSLSSPRPMMSSRCEM